MGFLMAKVLTGISGNVISAASAGFAPTNSADVSAIASSYQVVSATATQLYAGTAYVTSVNDNPLSASRAGNAANASMANSAYYDGTGRLISALPDSATVSAIASSYAESAASSKQDTLTFGYNTADQISSIDGSALGGMDEAAVSGIASAYAESAVSAASGNYYPATSNPSGYLTAQVQASWSESASASPSYIVDKPDLVDIVAGPGIVIDNPDGNTLRVSQSTFGAWENITNQFTWESNATDNGVRCLYNSTLKLLWMQGYVHLNVGTTLTKVCTLPSSMKTQLRLSELSMASTLEEKHGLLSTNLDRTALHFKWITVPSNKYVGFFLICPMEEV